MISFVRFDAMGNITASGSVPEGMVELQGGDVVVGAGESETHYVETITRTLKKKPSKPHPYSVWDSQSSSWVDDISKAGRVARKQRDELLAASDWTQLPDVPLETKSVWATYRQQLRDITDQPGWPTSINWPEIPSNEGA